MDTAEPTPLCGPVREGLMRLILDMPTEVFDELEKASLRHGLPLDLLVLSALCFAAKAP